MVSLSSSILLWTSMECAYYVAIVLINLDVLLIIVMGSSTLVSKLFIDRIHGVALAFCNSLL